MCQEHDLGYLLFRVQTICDKAHYGHDRKAVGVD